MQNDQSQNKDICQLAVLYDGAEELSLFDRLRNLSLRLASAVRRRLRKKQTVSVPLAADPALFEEAAEADNAPGISVAPLETVHGPLNPGDLVEVLSLEEIRKTLDATGRCEGLGFLLPMEKYCGKRVRVIKKVRTIFDERLRKMVKIRNSYLLENVICDGRDYFSREGCDRCCFLFWKDKWLRKVDG